ncbi:hypothetical protein BG004_006381 [Podila humilis]|nr:hypothetical protein BG004_006381 [Podila humilis]
MDTRMILSEIQEPSTMVDMPTVIVDDDFEDSVADMDMGSPNASDGDIYLRGGRQYCDLIGKPGALDTITKDTPLVLQAYIASKCERVERDVKEVDQEAEREIELLEGGDVDNTNKNKAEMNKSKNKKETS